MITIRRAADRHNDPRGKPEVWRTFGPHDRKSLVTDGFGVLEAFNENRLPPGAAVPRQSAHDSETLTYVREGALAYEDSMGRSGVIQAGEFHLMTAARGVGQCETNASRTEWAEIFQIRFRPSQAALEVGHEQKRFTTAERRSGLCLVASPDALRGSLRVHEDALAYSALLDAGQHAVHELSEGRSAWLHVVEGEVTLGHTVLTTGDGAGVSGERVVSFTAREESEILLLDLGQQPPSSSKKGDPR